MPDRTICFGIGATKAGSSWLYERLRAHPECHFRTIKELHYFEIAAGNHWDREIAEHEGRHKSILQRVGRRLAIPTAPLLSRHDFGNDKLRRLIDRAEYIALLEKHAYDGAGYLDYISAEAGDARVIGDITPAYSLLSDDWLRRMLDLGPDVRFVYVLRDPLDRLWSHVRMMAARRDPSGKATPERAHRILKRTLRGDERQIEIRSDYAKILPRLSRVIPDDKLLIEIFDDLATGQVFPRVCDFLGIARETADPTPVFESQKVPLKPDARAAALAWLAPQYAAVDAHLGGLPEGWARP